MEKQFFARNNLLDFKFSIVVAAKSTVAHAETVQIREMCFLHHRGG
jgi:hypothetical protein